jgi:hypothetical protein
MLQKTTPKPGKQNIFGLRGNSIAQNTQFTKFFTYKNLISNLYT